jgi:hypothetical protein
MKVAHSLLSCLLLAAGCGSKTEPTPSTAPANPTTAPGDYLGAVAGAKKRMESQIGASSVTQAIQQFAGEKGRYPKDLNELVSDGYLTALPKPPAGMKYQYHPQTGELKVVPAP